VSEASLSVRAKTFVAERRRAAAGNPWFVRGLLVFAGVLAVDQASKLFILYGLGLYPSQSIELSPLIDITYLRNTGVSFGVLAGGEARWALTVFSAAVTAGLLVWLTGLVRPFAAFGAALIAGGALGNAIDRALYGWVVDFIDASDIAFPWVFNVADSAINLGVASLLLDAWREGREARRDA